VKVSLVASVCLLLWLSDPAVAATNEQVAKLFERLRSRYQDGTMTLSFQFLSGVAPHARNAVYMADAVRQGWGEEQKEVAAFLERFSYAEARASVAVVQLNFSGSPRICYKEAFDISSGISCLNWSPAKVAAMALFFESIKSNTERFSTEFAKASSLAKKYSLMTTTTLEKNFVLPSAVSKSKAAFIEEALKPGALSALKAESPDDHRRAVEWLRSADQAAYTALSQIKAASNADRVTFMIDKSVFQVEPRQLDAVLKTAPSADAPLGNAVKWFIESSRNPATPTASAEILKSARDQIIELPKFVGVR
jgi:hypothetical protein